MLDGPLVFVDIDTQRDFLEPDGALFVPGSTEIIPNLERLTRFARRHGIPILATACAHRPDDPELRTFPPHCMIGTPGQSRVSATAVAGSYPLDERSSLPEPLPAHMTLPKHEYDLFTHPLANDLIGRLDADRPRFLVYGVATDYCVRAAALGLLDRGCRVALVVDAIRAIDTAAEPEILTRFARRGVLLTLTAVVCDDRGRLDVA
jgi:nicotinamidase/pyrazinamidase